MNIVLPTMHDGIDRSFKFMVSDYLKWNLYLLDDSWLTKIKYGKKHTQKSLDDRFGKGIVKIIDYQEFLDRNDLDIFFVPSYEQQRDITQSVYNIKKNSIKYCIYYGNEYRDVMDLSIFRNMLAADISAYSFSISHNVNVSMIRPPIDTSHFKLTEQQDSNIINSFINHYERLWPNGFRVFKECTDKVNAIFNRYGADEPLGLVSYEQLPQLYENSIATIHIKDEDGYGYTVIESMFSGRPVIIYRPFLYSRIKTMSNWVNEENSILFDSIEEFSGKMTRFIENKDFRQEISNKAYETVKSQINLEEQSEILRNFLENLV